MLPINPEIFKAYDIRGIYGQDYDNELGYLLGLAYVELRKKDSDYSTDKQLQIVVGCDMRLSSPALKENLIRGLTTAGAKVIDIGMVSTPTFYFAVGKYNYDGGLIVSASHNPKEWNGFKIVRDKGKAVSQETGIEFLKEKVLENRFIPAETPGEVIIKENILDEEIEHALKYVDLSKIKPFKIVADAANSMGAPYLEKLFFKAPGRLIGLNFELDGNFPAHEADPIKEENLVQLKNSVIAQQAHLGIATDGDGDRVFFIDNQGNLINPALIRGLLAKIFLRDKPGAKIGYDVRPGKITTDLIEENGGQAVMTRVGHSLIKDQMLKEDIYFAGESSGHFFLQTDIGCFEYPTIMILKLLEEFSTLKESVAEYVSQYNKYSISGEINRDVEDKEAVIKRIEEKYKDGKIHKLDGISVEYDNFWFNVRGSNTENKIRLNLEAVSKEVMEEKRDEVLELIK